MRTVPWPWRLLLWRSARRLQSRLVTGESVRLAAVVRHRRRTGGLAAVKGFRHGRRLALLALTDERVILVGAGGWIQLGRGHVLGADSRSGARGARLVVHTPTGDLAVDFLRSASVRDWRRALAPAVQAPRRPARPALVLVGAEAPA